MKTLAENLCELENVRHGFYSARGGVSTGCYATLNCGQGSRDNPRHVARNRQKVAEDLGVAASHLISPWQVHSARALIVSRPWKDGSDRPELDGLVTDRPGLALGVLTADCAPVLFCDPDRQVIAAAHAGWRGALAGVLEHTIGQMCRLGAARENIRATVGPAISQEVYEVSEKFRDDFLHQDESGEEFFVRPDNVSGPQGRTKPHFDLKAYARHRLEAAGLNSTGIIDHCTFQREGQYFSYRRSRQLGHPDYARQISAIVIG